VPPSLLHPSSYRGNSVCEHDRPADVMDSGAAAKPRRPQVSASAVAAVQGGGGRRAGGWIWPWPPCLTGSSSASCAAHGHGGQEEGVAWVLARLSASTSGFERAAGAGPADIFYLDLSTVRVTSIVFTERGRGVEMFACMEMEWSADSCLVLW
jgi:hypothetical protein